MIFHEVMPLDSCDELNSEDRISFIKIDVEGHELEALQGSKNILMRDSPVISFEQQAEEINNGASDASSFLETVGDEYFYELSKLESWKTPRAIPNIIRRHLQVIEGLILGVPSRDLELKRIEGLEKKFYTMIIASKNKIELKR